MKSRLRLLVLVALTIHANSANAQSVVVPNAEANVEGNIDYGYPFNISIFGFSSQRWQQVYGASDFGAITGPRFITALRFRPDGALGSAFSSTIPSIQINLSTTTAAVDALSLTFANNVGANDTVVFSGPLSLSSKALGGPPRDFDIVINLATPFLYNPANGNLLMDVRNFGTATTTQFDGEFNGSDPISAVFTQHNGGVFQPTADFAETAGLVTQFTFSSVPEPSTLMLLTAVAIGAVGYGFKRWLANRNQLAID